jgi:hypothetical protein
MAKKGINLSEEEMNDVLVWFESERKFATDAVENAKEILGKKEEKVEELDAMTPFKRYKKCMSKVRSDLLKPAKLKSRLAVIGDDIRLAQDEKLKSHRMTKIIEFYAKIYHKFKAAVDEAKSSEKLYPVIATKLGGFEDLTDAVPEMTRVLSSGEVDHSVVIVLTSDGEFSVPMRTLPSAG